MRITLLTLSLILLAACAPSEQAIQDDGLIGGVYDFLNKDLVGRWQDIAFPPGGVIAAVLNLGNDTS